VKYIREVQGKKAILKPRHYKNSIERFSPKFTKSEIQAHQRHLLCSLCVTHRSDEACSGCTFNKFSYYAKKGCLALIHRYVARPSDLGVQVTVNYISWKSSVQAREFFHRVTAELHKFKRVE